MVQWLSLYSYSAGDTGSIPSRGSKIPHATQPKNKKKKKNLEGAQTFTSSLDLANFWTQVEMILKAAQPRVPAFQSFGFIVCLFLQRESECGVEGR